MPLKSRPISYEKAAMIGFGHDGMILFIAAGGDFAGQAVAASSGETANSPSRVSERNDECHSNRR
jgi:hypothetical protein